MKEILVVQHVGIEGPGSIGEFFGNTAWSLKAVNLQQGDALPPDVRSFEAIIVLGGPMNVYEEDTFPYLKEEDRLLKDAVREEIPVLGICLGAQLLAKACGAGVSRAPAKEIGWFPVRLTGEGRRDPLFADLPPELTVFQWHEDMFDIPGGARLLATGTPGIHQAFRAGKNAWGLQFHVEATPDMIESWVDSYAKPKEAPFDAQIVLLEAHKRKEMLRRQSDAMSLNFARAIEASRKAAAAG